jgi:hypothetical protein
VYKQVAHFNCAIDGICCCNKLRGAVKREKEELCEGVGTQAAQSWTIFAGEDPREEIGDVITQPPSPTQASNERDWLVVAVLRLSYPIQALRYYINGFPVGC